MLVILGQLKECQKSLYSPPPATASQHDVTPKSILKSSTGYTQNLSRAKSPELRGMKLIKSVLKKESEESEQQIILPNSEVYPRSILKSNSYSRPIQTTSVDAAILRNERGLCSVESPNLNSETAKFCEKLDSFNVATNPNMMRDSCDEMRVTTSKQGNNMAINEAAVPSHKAALFRKEEIFSADMDNCKIDTISSSALERRSNERHDNSLAGKSNLMLDVADNNDDDNKDDGNDNNDDEDNEKDVGKEEEILVVKMERNDDDDDDDDDGDDNDDDDDGHKIHNIIVNEKLTSVARCSFNSLSKSISQHSLGDERWKPAQQRGLPLPGLCRSATQVIASIETNEIPSVSIADRLAALHHSGSTNWKRRVAGARDDESCDDSLLNLEESTIKSGVLAGCIEKLESAVESWKSRIVAPDAVNFTVAGKMKVAPSKDASSPFLTEATANISNQKKKVPRPHWFKMRKDEGKPFYIRME